MLDLNGKCKEPVATVTTLLLLGNAFGEAGIERIQEMVGANGLEEALQSLSDDEGEETDEDGESNKEEEEEEENGLLEDSIKEEAINKTVSVGFYYSCALF